MSRVPWFAALPLRIDPKMPPGYIEVRNEGKLLARRQVTTGIDLVDFPEIAPDRCEVCGAFTHETKDCPKRGEADS